MNFLRIYIYIEYLILFYTILEDLFQQRKRVNIR